MIPTSPTAPFPTLPFDPKSHCFLLLDSEGEILDQNGKADSFGLNTGKLTGFIAENQQKRIEEQFSLALSGENQEVKFRTVLPTGDTIKLTGEFIPYQRSVIAILREKIDKPGKPIHLDLRIDSLENSLCGFDLVDESGHFIYANKAYLELWGYDSLEQIVGQRPDKHCADPELPSKIISTLKRDGQGTFEFKARRRDGTTFDVRMYSKILRTSDGREIYTGSTMDISQWKESERELRKSKDHLRGLINSVEGIVWEADPETYNFIYVSPKAEQILGYPVEDWQQENFWPNHIHPDDRDAAVSYCHKSTAALLDHEFSYRMITADGRTVWIRDLVTVEVEDGKAKSLRGIMVDVTEEQQAREKIKQLNRTHSMLSHINQLIVREKDQDTLMMKGCQVAVDKGKFEMAWIGLVDPEDHRLKIVGHAGASEETLAYLSTMLGDAQTPPTCAFTARSLLNGEVEICNDVATDPESVEWREAALGLNYHSIASLPLRAGDTIIGNFNLYSNVPGFFDFKETALVSELAEDLSFALKVQQKERERQETERELRESQEKLNRSMRIAQLSHWEYDFEQESFLFDDHFYSLLNINVDDSPGLDVKPAALLRNFCHPEEIPRIKNLMQNFFRDSGSPSGKDYIEHRVICGDGSEGWLAVQIYSQTEPDGTRKVFGISQNITERKTSEIKIRRVEHLFRSLIEHSSDCIVLIDSNLTIRYASPSSASTEGFSPEALRGKTFTDRALPEYRNELVDSLLELVNTPGKTIPISWRSSHKDGKAVWLEGVATNLLHDPDVAAIVCNYRDISARKQLEEEFRQSQKLEAIGQLAGGVAHDFNNLLTVIQGYSSLLMMEDDIDESTGEASNQIMKASERAAALTRQLLAFSRRQVLQFQEMDVNENVTQLTSMFQRVIGADINLQIELNERELITKADAGMIDQILINLVVNARDAMPDGGDLSVSTRCRVLGESDLDRFPDLSPGNYVELSVSDSGIGIPEDTLEHIFEPFFTTKEPGKGTGLGLATVFGIVKQHGGTITVDSKVNEGTTFRILLPGCRSGNKKDCCPKSSDSASGCGTEHILLVEDEEAVRTLNRHVLSKAGYSVIEASSGVEALEIWEQKGKSIDLIFTDIVMPGGMSGLDLAEKVQQNEPQLKVIFISGYSADIAGRELTLKEGHNFLQKPCCPRDMLEAVRKCLDKQTDVGLVS